MILCKNIYLSLLLAAACTGVASSQEDPARVKARLRVNSVEQAIPAEAVKNIGGFAGDRIGKNEEHYLKTFPIGDYIRLMEVRDFTGWDWRQGEQPGKWLESAILTAARTQDAALENEARAMYQRVLRCQAPDGYIGITSQTVRTPKRPLGGMDAYELYFLQHALLTAYEVWHDPKGLRAARRLGDYFLRYIGPGKAEFWPSPTHDPDNKGKILKGTMHSEIAGHSIHYSWEGTLLIDPVMRLFELTGDRRYFDWCKWVVGSIDKWSGWDAYSNLDKVAAGEMTTDKIQPYVHTHTFQMNFLGLLRMYQAGGDPSYLRKVEGVWKDIAARQLYITGGVSVGEHYERDYIKPLTGEMMETCATMSWMQLSQYLLDLTGDPKYADAIERIQWNQVFAEQTIDGDANHYFTPPNGYTPKGYFREPDCCMGSGHRLLSLLPGFIYAAGAGHSIYINQFVPSATTIGKVTITQQTDFPETGNNVIDIDPSVASAFAVNIRIPAWCDSPRLSVNGTAVEGVHPGQYAVLTRTWHTGDKIVLDLPMQLQWVKHDHYMKTADRKPYKAVPDEDAPYALVRGPVVYAVDDIWYKGDTADFGKGWMDSVRYVGTSPAKLRQLPSPGKDILGPGYEVSLLLANGNKTTIPVYPFANIGKWYKDPAHKPDSNAAAWTYAIWLKACPDLSSRQSGNLSLPYIFGDNMVLQRNAPIPVWGSASPGAIIMVAFGNEERRQTKTDTADRQGHWRVTLDPLPASTRPSILFVTSITDSLHEGVHYSGMDMVMQRNILVGEVWLCSGQSNMEYSMRKNSKFEKAAHGAGPDDELTKADNPEIRIFLVKTNYSKPDSHIRRTWDTAAGAPLRDFSAAGYFFAKEIYRQLHVPVGIISSSVSGSRIEPWMPEAGPANALAGGDHDAVDTSTPGKFYETMIRPLAPFAIKGFLWYQGESNCFLNDTIRYTGKMDTLIGSWRGLWHNEGLSFYFVQIAPFYYSHSRGGDQAHTPETLPAFRAAQARALSLPHTGMVVTTDLVDNLEDIHPAYKWEVGRRLALLALAHDNALSGIEYSGPVFKEMLIRKHTVELSFTHTGGGLISKDGKPLSWFSIAGTDHTFVPATAVIKGDKVIVFAQGVNSPEAVRFGWDEAAQPNLFNKEGLPAVPFTTLIR